MRGIIARQDGAIPQARFGDGVVCLEENAGGSRRMPLYVS